MNHQINAFLLGGTSRNTTHQNIGFFLLRFFVGLALCTVFEKFFPRNGIWGPQEWFIQDTANMGFPFPVFFAWVAVLSEFFGGVFLMLGLFTRPAALANFFVTFTATFLYHKGDIGDAGLLSFLFMLMCSCILLFGPGKFSLDYVLKKRTAGRWVKATALILLLAFAPTDGQTNSLPRDHQADTNSIRFHLKNNGLLPRKVTFIIYQPQVQGNNTRVKWFLPFQKVAFDLASGSKIYIASRVQVATVMQGKRIDTDLPVLVVSKKTEDTTVRLSRRK